MGWTPVDVDREYGDCISQAMERSELQRQQEIVEQTFNRFVFYGLLAAFFAIVALLFIYRKPIRKFLENSFVAVAAKTITTKHELKEYRKDISQRVREKSKE